MSLGPVQLLVIGTAAQPDGSVLAELDRLADEGIVRLLDLVVVERTEEGSLDTLPAPPGLHHGLGRIAEEFLAGPAGFSPSEVGLAPAEEGDGVRGAGAGVGSGSAAVGGVGVVADTERPPETAAGAAGDVGAPRTPAECAGSESARAAGLAQHAGADSAEGALADTAQGSRADSAQGSGVDSAQGSGADSAQGSEAPRAEGAASDGVEGGSVADAPARTWSLLDAVPMGGTAVIALIEHVWARPLRAALVSAGAVPLGESWLGPADLADLEAIVDQHARPAPH